MRLITMLPIVAALSLAACTSPDGNRVDAAAAAPPAATADTLALDAAIHDYIVGHPEVVIQALQENQKRQQMARLNQAKEAIAANRAAITADPSDPVVGNAAGDVTVVEWFDAQCPFCKKVAPDLKQLIAADKGVKLVYKEFPILGEGSVIAAKAALAAMKQGKYEAFHDVLMADQTPEHQLGEVHILEIAKAVGLDVERLKADMAAPEIAAKVSGNRDLAAKLGINGTPGLVIGDQLTPGAIPYDALKQAVDQARTPRAAAAN